LIVTHNQVLQAGEFHMIDETDFTTETRHKQPTGGRQVEIHTTNGRRFTCRIVSVTAMNFLVKLESGSLEVIAFEDVHLMVGR
jgi:hypothetical protein